MIRLGQGPIRLQSRSNEIQAKIHLGTMPSRLMVGRRPLEANIPGSSPGSATDESNCKSESIFREDE